MSILWNEYVGLIETAALKLDEEVDRVASGGNVAGGPTLAPAAKSASKKKSAHFRRKSVMALATLGLTRTRVRAISKEAITPLERAVQRQERRRLSQESQKSSAENSAETRGGSGSGADEDAVPGPLKSSATGVMADSRRGSVRTIFPIFHVDDDNLDDHVVL